LNQKLCQHKYKYGTCNVMCEHNIPDTNLYYCEFHYYNEAKQYNKVLKLNEKAQKLKEKEQKKEEKAQKLEEKEQKKVKNVVKTESINIGLYVPDITGGFKFETLCKCILKTGPNKGKECGNKTVDNLLVCKKHKPKINT
jgi:hypothetical protein